MARSRNAGLVDDLNYHRMIGNHEGHGLDVIVGLDRINCCRNVVYFDRLMRLCEVNDKTCRLLHLFTPYHEFKGPIVLLKQQIMHDC